MDNKAEILKALNKLLVRSGSGRHYEYIDIDNENNVWINVKQSAADHIKFKHNKSWKVASIEYIYNILSPHMIVLTEEDKLVLMPYIFGNTNE